MSDTQLLTDQVKAPVAGPEVRGAFQAKPSTPGPESTPPVALTPSDLGIIDMIPWTDGELNGVVRVQVKNPPLEVIKSALAAAVLANEKAGAIHLKVVKEKVFFGLITRTDLVVTKAGDSAEWPAGSLEASLTKWVCRRSTTVSDIIYDWIGATTMDPKGRAVTRVMRRMVHRRLLDRVMTRRKVLKFFTVTSKHYVLLERTSDLITLPPVRLLETCQLARPEVYDEIMSDIENGFSRRSESREYDY